MPRILAKLARYCLIMSAALACVLLLGCRNFFSEFADPDSDAARIHAARMALDSGDYSGAIASIDGMTATGQSRRSVKSLKASAYAGRCGLNFLSMVQTIVDNASVNLFVTLMKAVPEATAERIDDCKEAEALMLSISASAANRTVNENLLLAMIDLSKIGAILATYADLDNNGSPDGSFDPCDVAQLPDDQARQIGTGIAIALDSLSSAGTDVLGNSLTTVSDACSSLEGIDPALNFCGVTSPDDLTAEQVQGIIGIVQADENPGLSLCGSLSSNLLACTCN